MKQFFTRETRDTDRNFRNQEFTALRSRPIVWLLLLLTCSGWLLAQKSDPSYGAIDSPAKGSFLVVLDPAHGGSDSGAHISGRLLEKNVTLEFARRLRHALEDRGIQVKMLRDADVTVSVEQRSRVANLARPSIFLSLHAAPGSALHVYTPLLPAQEVPATSRRSFLAWQTTQSAFLQESSALAASIAEGFTRHDVEAQRLPVSVAPLAAIAAPAVVVELPCDDHGVSIDEDRVVTALTDVIATRKDAKGAAH